MLEICLMPCDAIEPPQAKERENILCRVRGIVHAFRTDDPAVDTVAKGAYLCLMLACRLYPEREEKDESN